MVLQLKIPVDYAYMSMSCEIGPILLCRLLLNMRPEKSSPYRLYGNGVV